MLVLLFTFYSQASGQTLVSPTGTDQPWFATTSGVINGINTAIIDYPVAQQVYAQLAACAHGATMGTGSPINGVEVTDLTYNTTVSVPYPAGTYDMASVPDVILGNNPGATDPTKEFIMAVAFVNNNTPADIEIDYFDIVFSTPGAFTVTYNSSQYLPYVGTTTTPLGTVHLDVVAEHGNTSLYGLPLCDAFFVTFDATGGGTHNIYGDYGRLSSYATTIGTTDITSTFHPGDNWQPDVAGVQQKQGAGTTDIGIFTWVNQCNCVLYTLRWRPATGAITGTTSYAPGAPMTMDFFEYPRIDANDDYNTNTSGTNSNFKVVVEHQDPSLGTMNVESVDNVFVGQNTSSWITIPGGLNNFAPAVAYGAQGPLGKQYLTTETFNTSGTPGDYVIMQPIEEADPNNVAWDPLGGIGPSLRYNFIVNNTLGSGGSPTDMVPTNYTNAVSTPCNYVTDTSLVSWADYDGTNYKIWYKRSGYNWSGTGHYYRPAPLLPTADAGNEMTVKPNPASNSISLDASGSYAISNILGRVVQQGDLYPGAHDIDVHALLQGCYIISFTRAGGQPVQRKFTKL